MHSVCDGTLGKKTDERDSGGVLITGQSRGGLNKLLYA